MQCFTSGSTLLITVFKHIIRGLDVAIIWTWQYVFVDTFPHVFQILSFLTFRLNYGSRIKPHSRLLIRILNHFQRNSPPLR